MTMRTTLTLDDDVAAMLNRARAESPADFKALVNDLLRTALRQTLNGTVKAKPFRTRPIDAGHCLTGSLDNIEEVLDQVEGPLLK